MNPAGTPDKGHQDSERSKDLAAPHDADSLHALQEDGVIHHHRRQADK